MSTSLAEKAQNWLLNEEDCENDDRRFYCSYLISLTSLTMADFTDDQNFFNQMRDNLHSAFETDKLSETDKSEINELWGEACQQ